MEIQIEHLELTLYIREILVGLTIVGWFISRWFQPFR